MQQCALLAARHVNSQQADLRALFLPASKYTESRKQGKQGSKKQASNQGSKELKKQASKQANNQV